MTSMTDHIAYVFEVKDDGTFSYVQGPMPWQNAHNIVFSNPKKYFATGIEFLDDNSTKIVGLPTKIEKVYK